MTTQRHPWAWPYPRVRKQVLERDGRVCQIRSPNCTVRATQVDHIVPLAEGGPQFDPANLRAACQSCNNARNRKSAPPSRDW